MFGFRRKRKSPDSSGQKDRQVSAPSSGLKNSLLSLEQRLMFDAAAAATASEVATEQVAQEQAEAAVSDDRAGSDGQTADQAESQGLLDAIGTYNPGESRSEVVFVDPTVPNYQELLAGMDPHIEVVMLDGGTDGVHQMASALEGRTGLDAIHIISHGSAGELHLGTGTLSTESMSSQYAQDLATIQTALSEQADILVYGCDFAKGDAGQMAVDRLAEMTGADVEASTDLTGSISLGGDWEFEVQTGSIETSLAVSYDVQMDWAEVLGTNTVKDTFSSTSYSNNNGTQSWSSSWSETDAGGSGASGGDIRVNSSQLRIDTISVGDSISRGVNLGGANSATLTFDYTNNMGSGSSVALRISTDGGSSYQTLSNGTFSSTSHTGSGSVSFDLSGYMSANTKIQFVVTGISSSGGDRLFVDNVQVSYETNSAPTISNLGSDSLSYTEGAGAVVIDQGANALVVDSDSANFDTGTLTVSIPVGAEPTEDVLSIRNQGTGAGQIGVTGNTVTYGGVNIGTCTGGAGGNNLVVSFNSNATPTAVTALLKNITYEDINNDSPAEGSFTIRFALTDGDGGTSSNYDVSAYVSGVNDAPTDLSLSANTVAENAANGTVVGTLTATDPDSGDTKTYSLTDNAGGRFAINSSTGVLTVANGSLLNYETATSHTITVRVTDRSGLTYDETFTINLTDVNEAPPVITSNGGGATATITVAENTTAVTTVTATDADTRQTLTYSITGGVDAAKFSINSSTGLLSFVTAPNYETPTDSGGNNVYDVTVQVSDGKGGTTTQAIAVAVTNVNEAPTDITLTGSTVAENAATGTVVGTVAGTDVDAGDTKTYSLTDSAGGRFTINGTTGVLTVANGSLLNYEGATSHSVTVRVTDSGGLTHDKTFTIGVNNVNEAPTDIALTGSTVAENAATGTVVGTVAGTDVDAGDTKTYSLTDTAGGRFAINSSTGQITVANSALLNYESATSHSVTVRVTDSGGLTYDKIVTINLTNVNETPTALNLSANTVAENSANGTVVGTVSGTDPDSGDTKTYSLTDTAGGRFAINSSTGQITVANSALLNYESATSHSVIVRVTDSGGLTYDETFTINLTNVNEAPTGSDTTVTITEDTSHMLAAANFGFGDVDAGDSLSAVRIDTIPAAGTLTLSGVAITAGHIVSVADITAGNLVFTPAADANGTGYATFTFSVRDSNNAYDEAPNTLTFDVTAVNDAPINTVPGDQTVAVDTPLLISGLSVNDVDGDLTTVELAVGNGMIDVTLSGDTKISAGANGTATITLVGTQADINATLSSLTYQGTSLFAGLDTLKVISSDATGGTDTDTVSITVSNNAPTNHVPGPQTVDEDTALEIKGVCVTDGDGNLTTVELSVNSGILTVRLSGGAIISSGGNGSSNLTLSGSQSDINDTLALLTYQGNPDFAGLDTLSIRSTDKTGVTDTDTVSITVTPVNDAPTDLEISSSVVAEHATNGTTVGSVTPTDPDSGDTFTYQLTDTAGGRFAINAATGEITVADGSLLHSEVASSHDVTVRVTDSGGVTYDKTFTINLIDVNEAPEDLVLSSNTVGENAANGTVIGTVTGTDFDTGDTVRYSFTDSAGGRFAINSNTGVITVANGSLLNYESATSHTVTVRVTDGGGLTYDKAFTINLTNVNETPTDLSLSANTVAENAANGTVVGIVSGTDPDSGDTKTYSFTDSAGGRFAINASTGQITVADGTLLDCESATSHSVTVRVTDSGGLIYDKTFTINLTNMNEAPTNITLTGSTIAENAATGTVVGTAAGTDGDAGDIITYSLTDTAGGRFAINSTTGVITVADGSLLNYEANPSHSITVRVTDSSGLTYDKTVTIEVTNVNDGPTDLTLSGSTVAENASSGTVVGTVSGTDPDAGDTKTYSLTDTAGGRFAINSTTGVITVADGSLLNYEANPSHSITVRVTDSGGLSYDKTFTIGLSHVAHSPTISPERNDGPSLVASLLHSVRGLPESRGTAASSSSTVQDTRTNDPSWSDDSKNSIKLSSLPAQKMDVLSLDRNHQELGSEDGMHQMGRSSMAESFLHSSSNRDGTIVSRDFADEQSVARLELGQVPRPHGENAENLSSEGSHGGSMPMLAGLVEVALQGGLGTEDNLGTANTQMRKRYQAASSEKKSQPQPVDDQERPPSAA